MGRRRQEWEEEGRDFCVALLLLAFLLLESFHGALLVLLGKTKGLARFFHGRVRLGPTKDDISRQDLVLANVLDGLLVGALPLLDRLGHVLFSGFQVPARNGRVPRQAVQSLALLLGLAFLLGPAQHLLVVA